MTPPSTLYALFAIFQSRYDVVHLLIGIGLIGIGLIALATIITLATKIRFRKKNQTKYYQNQITINKCNYLFSLEL